jgi:YD repeat-containing protein
VTSSLFDAQGKVLQIDAPDVESLYFQYDADGRLLTTTQGTRVTGRTYGLDGMLASVTNPLLETTAFGRNARGDVLTETRADLEVTAFGYDGEGHTTSVTPPDKPAHSMVFNAIEELGSYTPPTIPQGATATSYSYDLDKMLDTMTQPGPRLVDYGYDSAGRLDEILFPTGSVTRSYSPTTGHVVSIGGPSGVALSMTYDGSLQKSVTFSGAVSGTVAWDHDTDFRVVTETVNGSWEADFSYDPDSLLTSAGDSDHRDGRVTQ